MADNKGKGGKTKGGAPVSEYHKIFYPNGQRSEEEFALLAELVGEHGFTDAQIAAYFGVSRVSIGNWKNTHAEFFKVLKENKVKADDKVEHCLFERATGYDFYEEKIFVNEGVVTRVQTIKHIPPDVNAGKFWLLNRRPDKWKEVVHNNNLNENKDVPTFDYSKLNEAEQDKLEELLAKAAPKPIA